MGPKTKDDKKGAKKGPGKAEPKIVNQADFKRNALVQPELSEIAPLSPPTRGRSNSIDFDYDLNACIDRVVLHSLKG